MSAWIVDDRHIDAMLSAAMNYSRRSGSVFAWLKPAAPEPDGYQRGDPWGPEAVEIAISRRQELTTANASNIGRMLLLENYRSVSHRYNDDLALPEYIYRHNSDIDAVGILKAIDCYSYQSCEHPGWEGGSAYAFCEALRRKAISHLPGYDVAPWGIT